MARLLLRLRALLSSPAALGAAAVLLFLLNTISRYPGEPSPDSDWQYAQILSDSYNDWHPPAMARLWSLLLVFGEGTGPIFVFHLLLYWLGFGLIAATLARRSRPLMAWAVLLFGAAPPLVMLNINITKDVGLAAVLVSAFALIYRYRGEGLAMPRWVAASAMVLVIYAALVRGNAVFAVGPFLIYLFAWRSIERSGVRIALVSAVVGFLLIPVSIPINRHLLGAEHSGAESTLQLFDIAGTARISNDPALMAALGITPERLKTCYSPIMWDSIRNRCPKFTQPFLRFSLATLLGNKAALSHDGGAAADPPTEPRPLTHLWITAITTHPMSYLVHRLLSFNSSLYLYVPSHHTELIRVLSSDADRTKSAAQYALDLVRYNVISAPGTVFAMNLALLLFLWRVAPDPETRRAALALLLSALGYGLSFLPFGVATDPRYFLWPTIAVGIATVLLAPAILDSLRRRPAQAAWIFAPVAVAVFAAGVARLTNDASLLLLG